MYFSKVINQNFIYIRNLDPCFGPNMLNFAEKAVACLEAIS